jgi:hypothetical protein
MASFVDFKNAAALACCALAVALSSVLALTGIQDLNVAPDQIAAAAPEDLLGFGFWFSWLFFAVPESLLLFAAYRAGRGTIVRQAVYLIGALFLGSSIFAFTSYAQFSHRVFQVG